MVAGDWILRPGRTLWRGTSDLADPPAGAEIGHAWI